MGWAGIPAEWKSGLSLPPQSIHRSLRCDTLNFVSLGCSGLLESLPAHSAVKHSATADLESLRPQRIIQRRDPPCNLKTTVLAQIVLPGALYAGLIPENSQYSYHLLQHASFSMGKPFEFDADAFVQDALGYCKDAKIEGVFGFDCFPSLLTSIINQSLGLPGPSFQSVFLCINKFYMRKVLCPEITVHAIDYMNTPAAPETFPLVVKLSDCQFYVGTKIIHNIAEWDNCMSSIRAQPATLYDRRKKFYFKWMNELEVDPQLQVV